MRAAMPLESFRVGRGWFSGRPALRSAFSAGQFTKSLAWYFIDLLLAYYANTRLGLSASQTGLLLFLSMAQSMVADMGAALLLHRIEGNRRQILIVQFLAAIATAIALLLIFVRPPGFLTPFQYLIGALALFRTAFAFLDVAQNALTSLLPADEEDAHHFAIWRQVAINTAKVGVSVLAFLMVGRNAPAAGNEVAVTGVMAVLLLLASIWLLGIAGAAQPRRMATRKWSLATPSGLAPLLVAAAALAGPIALLAKLVPFVQAGGLGDQTGAALLFAIMLGAVFGPLAVPRPGGSATGAAWCFTATAMGAAALFLANSRSGPISLTACFAYGLGAGGMLALFWRGLSSVIRVHARNTGIRTDLAAFALVAAMTKLAAAVSGASFGVLLNGFKAGSGAAMLGMTAMIAAAGLCFMLTMMPTLRLRVQDSERLIKGSGVNPVAGSASSAPSSTR
jgi:Na+/melibiose symporter-like transporter